MKKDFNEWLSTMKDSIASWKYYTDFDKVYKNVDSIKVELNILNSLIGSKNIREEFISLANRFPSILNVIPILLAKREKENCHNQKELIARNWLTFIRNNLPIIIFSLSKKFKSRTFFV